MAGSSVFEPPEKPVAPLADPAGEIASHPVALFLKEQIGASRSSDASQRADQPEQVGPAGSKQLWTGEVDQLFVAAFDELRRRAEQRLETVEKRRNAEITELSQAIRKQHSIIEALKRELAQAKEMAALKLFEAEQKWRHSEAERMHAARQAWEREKEELARETSHQRSIADQLADQLAALKATAESKEGQLFELKRIAAEIDRCLLLARSEWQSEVARLEAVGWELPSCLKEPVLPPQEH
jgi:hypothetical protein